MLGKGGDLQLAKKDFMWINTVNEGYFLDGEIVNGYWSYIGHDDVVILPESLDGKKITSCYNMFKLSHVKKVICNHEQIKNTELMFSLANTEALDLSELNINKATNMRGMFMGARIGELILPAKPDSNSANLESLFYSASVKSIVDPDL